MVIDEASAFVPQKGLELTYEDLKLWYQVHRRACNYSLELTYEDLKRDEVTRAREVPGVWSLPTRI